MKNTSLVRFALILTVGFGCLAPFRSATAAQPDEHVPPLIRAGFDFFEKRHPERGVDVWKEGGLVGEEFRSIAHATYFQDAEKTLGKYLSYDWITSKPIGKSSKIVYLSINYDRGAVYGRFLVYLRDKDWVVQSMNFNTRPEALMPWLAFEGDQQ